MIVSWSRIIHMKWLQHLIFWMLSIYIIASYFAISNELELIDFIYAILFHGCLWSIVYLNLKLSIPYLWKKDRYLLYVVSLILISGIGILIHRLLFDVIGPRLIADYFFVSFTQTSVLIQIFIIYLLLSTLIHLSGSWFQLQQIQKEKIELELAALKSQLNPHFLFNGLNSLYALTLKNDPKAPSAILKLSELLRYSLYESGKEQIPIKIEISMIESYLEIQKTRLKKPENIRFFNNISSDSNIEIPPMLLLPLVENAFKHGDVNQELTIKIDESSHDIYVEIINFNGMKSESHETSSGIGLMNIQRRLDLMYTEKYSLKINQTDKQFMVQLKLTIK